MIERINFWGIPHGWHILGYIVPSVCAVVLVARLYLRARLWRRIGRPEARWDHLGLRLKRLVTHGVAQVKVLRQTYPGLMHVAIAWGFFVFFLGTALATIDADFVQFLRGPVYLGYKLLLDMFTALAVVGFALAAYRRFIQKPERLTLDVSFAWALTLAFLTVLTGLLTESLRLAAITQDPTLQPGWHAGLGWWTPAGWVVAQIWLALGLTTNALESVHLGLWLGHIGAVGLFFVLLPTGPLLHVLTAPANIFFAPLDRPPGQLAAPAGHNGDVAGIGHLADLTWPQLMQADACTECGRCQDVCPAHGAGQALSPKRVIRAIKDSLTAAARLPRPAGNGDGGPSLAGEGIQDEAVWACTTCRACVAECPVLIEHLDVIVGRRRHLLTEQRADSQLTTALANLRRYGNSFGKSEKQRARWTTGLDFKIKDLRKEQAQTLWFVGDYASYSPALTEVTQATARIFRQMGLDFALLYDAERNAGNDLRRTGEEGLFEMLVQKNLGAIEKCEFEDIVTTDPHTYSTLKNEYTLGTNGQRMPLMVRHPVHHYSEVIARAIQAGRLRVSQRLGYRVTYHDPCYLGRYNNVYEAPRAVLRAIGCELIEMPRHRERALCCGAGGGRIWMDEGEVRERPSENRVREAADLPGVQCLVVACPKDLTMYRDAVKTTGLEGRLVVKDLAELVEEAVREEASPAGSAPSAAAEAKTAPPEVAE